MWTQPYDKWLKEELLPLNLPHYVFQHVSTMAKLIEDNRYDQLTWDVQKLIGKPSMSVREFVTAHSEVFSNAVRQQAKHSGLLRQNYS
jgi:NAD(P)H dehydrogenase (quinone)